jgi:hypothetical protein
MPIVSMLLDRKRGRENLMWGSLHHKCRGKGFQERKTMQAGGKR